MLKIDYNATNPDEVERELIKYGLESEVGRIDRTI